MKPNLSPAVRHTADGSFDFGPGHLIPPDLT